MIGVFFSGGSGLEKLLNFFPENIRTQVYREIVQDYFNRIKEIVPEDKRDEFFRFHLETKCTDCPDSDSCALKSMFKAAVDEKIAAMN